MDNPILIGLIAVVIILLIVLAVLFYQLKSNSGVSYSEDKPSQKPKKTSAQDIQLIEAKRLIKSGQLSEAQQTLSTAIQNSPQRSDLRLLQLAVFAKLNDSHGFENGFDALSRLDDQPALAKANQMRSLLTPSDNELPMDEMLARSQSSLSVPPQSAELADHAPANTASNALDDSQSAEDFAELDFEDDFGDSLGDDFGSELTTSSEKPNDALEFDMSSGADDLSITAELNALTPHDTKDSDSIAFDDMAFGDSGSDGGSIDFGTEQPSSEEGLLSLDFEDISGFDDSAQDGHATSQSGAEQTIDLVGGLESGAATNTSAEDDLMDLDFEFEQSPDEQLANLEDQLTSANVGVVTHDEFLQNQSLNMLATKEEDAAKPQATDIEFDFNDSELDVDLGSQSVSGAPDQAPELSLDLIDSGRAAASASTEPDPDLKDIKVHANLEEFEHPESKTTSDALMDFDFSDGNSLSANALAQDGLAEDTVSLLDTADDTGSLQSISDALDTPPSFSEKPPASSEDGALADLDMDFGEDLDALDAVAPAGSNIESGMESGINSGLGSELDNSASTLSVDDDINFDDFPTPAADVLATDALTTPDTTTPDITAPASESPDLDLGSGLDLGLGLDADLDLGSSLNASADDGLNLVNLDTQASDTKQAEQTVSQTPDLSTGTELSDGLDDTFDFDSFDQIDQPIGETIATTSQDAVLTTSGAETASDNQPTNLADNPDMLSQLKADFGFVDAQDFNQVNLALASSYIQLGEHQSAKSLLGEVMNAGNIEQRTEAEQLLQKIA